MAELRGMMQQVLDRLAVVEGRLEGVEDRLAGVESLARNASVRARNTKAFMYSAEAPLHPLVKERSPGAAGRAAIGSAPPPGLFPATPLALDEVRACRCLAALSSTSGTSAALPTCLAAAPFLARWSAGMPPAAA
ncbi:hypothetical protein ABPG75_012440 [Micractinium tetrahymenae]